MSVDDTAIEPESAPLRVGEKPYWEWIRGRRVVKTGGQRSHALTQSQVIGHLSTWAQGRGDAVLEWDLRLRPHGVPHPRLVPDVAYMSRERLESLPPREREMPTISPEIIVEILAADDVPDHLAYKRDVYFACGAELFLQIDPLAKRLEAFDADGSHEIAEGDTYRSHRFPDLVLPLRQIFGAWERFKRRA